METAMATRTAMGTATATAMRMEMGTRTGTATPTGTPKPIAVQWSILRPILSRPFRAGSVMPPYLGGGGTR